MTIRRSFRIFLRLATLSLLIFFVTGCAYRADNSHVLESAERVRQTALNQDNYGIPVKLDAVVIYYDPEWHLLFIQDASGGLFLNLKEPVGGLSTGTHVVVRGKLAPPSIGIEDPHFQLLGIAPMPVPQSLPSGSDPKQLRLSQWVKVQGTIRLASIDDGRLTLMVVDGSARTRVRVRDRKKIAPFSLVGAKVQFDGVSAAAVDEKGNWTGTQVFIDSIDDLNIGAMPVYAFDTRPDSFGSVLQSHQSARIVHLAGTVAGQTSGQILSLTDGSQTVKALLADSSQFVSGDCVELIGFTSPSTEYQIEDAIVRIIAPRQTFDESKISGSLHTLRQLKSLSVDAATKQIPVDIKGKVTFVDLSASILFVQDATAGAYVDIHNQSLDLRPGDLVNVKGVSNPGEYAPIVSHPKIKVLAHGTLPKPSTLSLQALASGNSDGGWVQVSGIVRSVQRLEHQHTFKLAIGGNSFPVQFPWSLDTSALHDRLLDAQVRVNAVCGTIFNEKRQLVGIRFFIPDAASVQILEPAPAEAASVVRPVATLLRFDPLNLSMHRVKVRGVVTLQDKNQNFYVQDSTAGIYVVADQKTTLQPGQVVEVQGFAVADPEGPYLDDATVVPLNVHAAITPVKLGPEEMSTGSYDSKLVRVEGKLLERIGGTDQVVLILQAGLMVLRVRTRSEGMPPGVRQGSLLEVTGILQKEDQASSPSYRIASRSSSDIRVLEAASWWTPGHTVRASAIAVIAILVVMLWVVMHAYRVRTHQAKHDPMTGLQNRNATLEYLERQMARAMREESSIGIILADVDFFKKINDTHGHLAGDSVLRRIATILNADLRPYDAAGRYGGEEFLIVVPNCDAAMATDVAERIRMRIEQDKFSPALPAQSAPVTCSFGIAIADNATWTVDSLLHAADCALYEAKNSGRNKTVLASGQPSRTMSAAR
jgi:diguanylate cyclase (GGDEF)-like protein